MRQIVFTILKVIQPYTCVRIKHIPGLITWQWNVSNAVQCVEQKTMHVPNILHHIDGKYPKYTVSHYDLNQLIYIAHTNLQNYLYKEADPWNITSFRASLFT